MKILKFEAKWCTPCHRLTKIISELSPEQQQLFTPMDIEEDSSFDLIEKYKIRAVPTLIVLSDNNELLFKEVGAVTKNTLEEIINKFNK